MHSYTDIKFEDRTLRCGAACLPDLEKSGHTDLPSRLTLTTFGILPLLQGGEIALCTQPNIRPGICRRGLTKLQIALP